MMRYYSINLVEVEGCLLLLPVLRGGGGIVNKAVPGCSYIYRIHEGETILRSHFQQDKLN